MSKRSAVVLLNLGAPDSLEAVRPFLFNLFNDKAIFRLPQPFRSWLAAFASKRRAPVATEIYRHLGGASPLLPNTEAQAEALHQALGGGPDRRVFIAMRYWHPFAIQAAADVQEWGADEVLLLPLYPQFSTTTTASSLQSWTEAAKTLKLNVPTGAICCYPVQAGFVAAAAQMIAPVLIEARSQGAAPRLLLSAHGLPERVVRDGDPYQFQCEQTANAIVARLADMGLPIPEGDWTVCYQSRVGPLKWIGPATDEEIRRAGKDGRPVVIAPIAFVSDHSETLVEIEIEYRQLALEAGVPAFFRVDAVGTTPDFIAGLAAIVEGATPSRIRSGCGKRICPSGSVRCPMEEL